MSTKKKYEQRAEKEFNYIIDKTKDLIAIIEQHEYSVTRNLVVLDSGYIKLEIKPIFPTDANF